MHRPRQRLGTLFQGPRGQSGRALLRHAILHAAAVRRFIDDLRAMPNAIENGPHCLRSCDLFADDPVSVGDMDIVSHPDVGISGQREVSAVPQCRREQTVGQRRKSERALLGKERDDPVDIRDRGIGPDPITRRGLGKVQVGRVQEGCPNEVCHRVVNAIGWH